MKVKEIMTKKVVTAKKSDRISQVAKLMTDYDIGMVVIINDTRDILGVVTDRDIVVRGICKGISADEPVEKVMTNHCVSIRRDESAVKALEMMGEYQVRRIVVTNEENKLAGVISLGDFAMVKTTNKLVNEILYEISIPNPQREKPLKYLEVEDYPL
ncbi:MAG TPA: CBS domain-containing protein [Acholeplasmataceae bacterium]|jgi:CBS domain-containing protein|nr:CBS domain-containing protein [Acholeplasmataceae bacterium]